MKESSFSSVIFLSLEKRKMMFNFFLLNFKRFGEIREKILKIDRVIQKIRRIVICSIQDLELSRKENGCLVWIRQSKIEESKKKSMSLKLSRGCDENSLESRLKLFSQEPKKSTLNGVFLARVFKHTKRKTAVGRQSGKGKYKSTKRLNSSGKRNYKTSFILYSTLFHVYHLLLCKFRLAL